MLKKDVCGEQSVLEAISSYICYKCLLPTVSTHTPLIRLSTEHYIGRVHVHWGPGLTLPNSAQHRT